MRGPPASWAPCKTPYDDARERSPESRRYLYETLKEKLDSLHEQIEMLV